MLYFLIFSFGLCIGSFLNVVISRGPVLWGLAHSAHTERLGFATPRSQCASCHTPLKSWHLIPVFSWLVLRGRCAYCRERISIRYPLVELAVGVLAVALVRMNGWYPETLFLFVAACLIVALGVIDLETGYLPDMLTLPLIALGLIGGLISEWFWGFVPFFDALIGAIVGYGVFWLIRFIYLKMRGIEGLGLGDAKMLAGLGAVAGWMSLPLVVLAASLAGLVFVGIMHLRGKVVGAQTAIRFGPFLAIGGLLILLSLTAYRFPWEPVERFMVVPGTIQ
ncbi:prepilin peptidase [Parvularcula flava]|uniref:Prepilin leader peptidase/N-methyltransferase n=1 Tax=Aquisalinus luteolus TaxID=1566827 RepID=A0ABX0HLY7_9PROT|nr:A24 family peptidase [Aquisalinus luteolus]NHK29067.1 prepilin peptidase [Aquisalinus luteolus]